MTSGVYEITNQVNGKRYVGSSLNIKKRWGRHLSELRRGQHSNAHLQCAFDKYGESAFTFSILEHVENIPHVIPREQHYLDMLLPEYNMAPVAGSSLGRPRSPETRAKLSEANEGHAVSEEAKQKMRAAWTPERRQAQADRMRQRFVTKATRFKMSEAKIGERNHNYGKHLSEEHRRKLSEAHKTYWRRVHAETD